MVGGSHRLPWHLLLPAAAYRCDTVILAVHGPVGLECDPQASIAAIAKHSACRTIDKVQSGAGRTVEDLELAVLLCSAVIEPPGLNVHACPRTLVDEMSHDGELGADQSLIV